jgi:hypothetical protein
VDLPCRRRLGALHGRALMLEIAFIAIGLGFAYILAKLFLETL